MHLTERQLNEYLDNAADDRARSQTHLDSCDDCAARLATLQTLFAELDSLPDLAFTSPLAARVLLDLKRTPRLPRWLPLTSVLQTAAAVVALILAAPFVTDLLSSYFVTLQLPSFAEMFAQLQTQWLNLFDTLANIQLPTLPEMPVLGLSSIVIMSLLAGVSMLWLVGNGLLLRNQIK